MKRLKALREVKARHDIRDLQGWTISSGTVLYVMAEGPRHPTEGHRVLVVRVDNGTGHLEYMPETAIHDTDL